MLVIRSVCFYVDKKVFRKVNLRNYIVLLFGKSGNGMQAVVSWNKPFILNRIYPVFREKKRSRKQIMICFRERKIQLSDY
jgi:hypothetical protein